MRHSRVRNADELAHLRERLQTLLADRNLLPAELAAKTIVPLSSLTRILNGEVKNPGLDVVISLAKGLGVTLSELVGEAPPRETEHTTLTAEGADQIGILRDLTQIMANEDLSITTCFATAREEQARVVLTIETPQPEQLNRIRKQIKQTPTVKNMRVLEHVGPNLQAHIADYLRKNRRAKPATPATR